MSYEAVVIYKQGAFLGYGILNEADKLDSVNVWYEGEETDLCATIERLNTQDLVTTHWPSPEDPDVLALTDDREWEPVEWRPVKVIDYENSTIVYERMIKLDEAGFPVFDENDNFVYSDEDTDVIDGGNSEIVYQFANAPDPAMVQARHFKAMEVVARRRAGLEA